MTPEQLTLLVNGGIGAVLLFLYLKQDARMQAMSDELNKVRQAQWELIVTLVGEDVARQVSQPPWHKDE